MQHGGDIPLAHADQSLWVKCVREALRGRREPLQQSDLNTVMSSVCADIAHAMLIAFSVKADSIDTNTICKTFAYYLPDRIKHQQSQERKQT